MRTYLEKKKINRIYFNKIRNDCLGAFIILTLTHGEVFPVHVVSICKKMDYSSISICSWNVNGIASLCRCYGGLLNALRKTEADFICIQETKIATLDWYCCITEDYFSYFSLHRPPKAYSGTATFVKKSFTTYKSQDGLTGQFCKSKEDQIIEVNDIDVGLTKEDLLSLDSEGRCIMTGIDLS